LGHAVAVAHASGARPIVIGGGHEVAWGSWQGTVAEADRRGTRKIGVINFDAHFDLRAGAQGNSGTSFRQIADDCGARGIPFNYLCVGVAKSANTAALFERAQTLGARWVFDDELTPWNIAQAQWVVADFMERVDVVHLSLDLDVLPAAVAPGVSAPAARGVNLAVLELLLDQVLASGKVLVAEMAELNPRFDIDHRTARVAARLVDRICGVDWRIQRAAG
jgi:formiminoglutamase